jgi:hypothetical protein
VAEKVILVPDFDWAARLVTAEFELLVVAWAKVSISF